MCLFPRPTLLSVLMRDASSSECEIKAVTYQLVTLLRISECSVLSPQQGINNTHSRARGALQNSKDCKSQRVQRVLPFWIGQGHWSHKLLTGAVGMRGSRRRTDWEEEEGKGVQEEGDGVWRGTRSIVCMHKTDKINWNMKIWEGEKWTSYVHPKQSTLRSMEAGELWPQSISTPPRLVAYRSSALGKLVLPKGVEPRVLGKLRNLV